GMSCGFCHVGPSPVKPPTDPENPQWANLNSNPGAQYFWVDRVFFWDKDDASFAFQLFHTSLPGTLDTSFISTDYINNPRTMNAVYNVLPRLGPALRWGREKLAGGGLENKQFQDFNQTADVALFFLKTAKPDQLKDAPGGSDYLTADKATLDRGKVAFATYCARCHSSKIPEAPANVDESNWNQYWAWTKTDDFKEKM